MVNKVMSRNNTSGVHTCCQISAGVASGVHRPVKIRQPIPRIRVGRNRKKDLRGESHSGWIIEMG